ncbi:unnamed protein product [Ectocarpus sp. 13 AM-2016]
MPPSSCPKQGQGSALTLAFVCGGAVLPLPASIRGTLQQLLDTMHAHSPTKQKGKDLHPIHFGRMQHRSHVFQRQTTDVSPAKKEEEKVQKFPNKTSKIRFRPRFSAPCLSGNLANDKTKFQSAVGEAGGFRSVCLALQARPISPKSTAIQTDAAK